MDTIPQLEQPYRHEDAIGMAVVVACGMLSFVSVLGVLVILGMPVVRNRRSPDETHFVRTHVAMYFLSLLLCNLAQAIGALFNIVWIVKMHIYIGTICTAQAIIKQLSSVGIAIFTFTIAIHNFSLLFFHCQWSDRTSYIALIISWGVLVLDLCIGNFALANPKKGSYYGIAGYWCWISPAYSTERLTTEYLFIFISAGSTFILYLLVFFRIRGNITVSAGYKIHFHQRPQFRVSRTIDGAYIMTDDRRIESHLMVVARRMLRHPISYIILVLPIAATRLSGFSGTSAPFPVIIFSASVFALTGFVNAVLICSARNGLSGEQRQGVGIASTLDHERGGAYSPSWRNSTRRYTGSNSRQGAVETRRSPVSLSSIVEEDVEIEHEEALPSPSVGYPTSPTWPLRAYGGRQRADSDSHHTGYLSSLVSFDERMSVRTGVYPVGEDDDLAGEVHSADSTNEVTGTVLRHPLRISRRRGTIMNQPAQGLEAPAPVYPLATASATTANTRRARPASVVTFETAINQIRVARGEEGVGSGTHWTGYIR